MQKKMLIGRKRRRKLVQVPQLLLVTEEDLEEVLQCEVMVSVSKFYSAVIVYRFLVGEVNLL